MNLTTRLLPNLGYIRPENFDFDQDQSFRQKIELDIKFRAVEENLLAEVAGIDFFLTDPNKQDNPTLPYYTSLLRKTKGFLSSRMCLAQSVMWGLAIAKIEGSFSYEKLPGDSKVRRWWYPKRLLDVYRDRIRRSIHYIDGRRVYLWNIYNPFKRRWDIIRDESEYIWSEYRPEERRLGYGNGLGKSLYYSYKLLSILFEMLAIGAQRFADSWIIAKIENLRSSENMYGDADTIDQIVDEIEKMRAFGVLVVDKENDVSTLGTGGGNGYQLITESIKEIKKDIIVLLTGVNMVTQIDGGGSYAAAQTQAEQMNKRLTVQREMSVAEPLTDWLLPVIYKNNMANFQAMGLFDYSIPKFNVSGGTVFNASERLPIFQFAKDSGIEINDQDIREQLQLSPVSRITDKADFKPVPKQEEISKKESFNFAAAPEIDKVIKKKDSSQKIPRELMNALDDLGVDIFRRYTGTQSDIQGSQDKAIETIQKILAYYDIQGQKNAVNKIEAESKRRGIWQRIKEYFRRK